jgi:ribosomal protein S18 acetylase RimI-like enzyme
MSKLIFHVQSPEDIRTTARLAREIWTEHYIPIVGRDQIEYMLRHLQSPEAIARQIREGMRYWLLGGPETPAGYVAYKVEADHVFLSKLYVARAHRGNGWSRIALDHLIHTESPTRIRLTVNRHNPSIAIYQALGFHKTGTRVADVGGGFVMDDDIMEKPLHPSPQ